MKNNISHIGILDCTIRDGSYLINYQFTTEDTYLITSALCQAGIERIEVGHGLGLGAQDKGKGSAADRDMRYIEAAVDASVGRALIGSFYIPGIGTTDDIRKAADLGLGFIRVGTNIDEYQDANEAIELAKKCGLEVWSNLMKSYSVQPKEFSKICKKMEQIGADIVVLVDSAGGMTPYQIKNYTGEALSRINIPLGFHGHNNLQLAVANCLSFAVEGGSFIDTSLRGMGRSAGNAATEVISALLSREGFDIGNINYRMLMKLAENLIAPGMPRDTGLRPVEIASGIACFHSSFEKIVEEASFSVGAEPYQTILELPIESRLNVTKEMAETSALKACKHKMSKKSFKPPNNQWVKRLSCSTLDEFNHSLKVLSGKTGLPIVMTMSRPRSTKCHNIRITPIRLGQNFCIGHIESASGEQDKKIWEYFKKYVFYWMADRQIHKPEIIPPGTSWLSYDDDFLLGTALEDMLRLVCEKNDSFYSPESSSRVANFIRMRIEFSSSPPFDVGVAHSLNNRFNRNDIEKIKINGKLIVVQPNAIEPGILSIAKEMGVDVLRLELGEALVSEVERVFNTKIRFDLHTGKKVVNGINVVAGGVVGDSADIVVDSISSPTLILGRADGSGGLDKIGKIEDLQRNKILNWMAEINESENFQK